MENTKKTITHTKRYQRQCTFGIRTLIGVAIIIIGLLAWTFITWRSLCTNNDELEMYKALDVFSKINDIAHLEMTESAEEGNPFNEEGIRKFKELDLEFYNGKNPTEKFRTAKKIVDFLIEQEKYHPRMDFDLDEQRDEEFTDLLELFNQIQ